MKKIYCKDPSLDKKEYSLTPAIAALSVTTYSDDNALKELVHANNVNAALTEANKTLKQEIALLKQKLDAINETVDNDLLRAIVKGSLPPSTIVKPNCMQLTYL